MSFLEYWQDFEQGCERREIRIYFLLRNGGIETKFHDDILFVTTNSEIFKALDDNCLLSCIAHAIDLYKTLQSTSLY